jgi:hypothetical protein
MAQTQTGGRGRGGISTKIQGVERTVQRLQAFDRKLRTKWLRQAGNEASKILLKEMKQNTPTRKKDYGIGGATKKSLGRKVKVFGKGTAMWYGVGPRTKWTREVNHPVKFFRNKATGRIHKIKLKERQNADPLGGYENQQPSRKMHLVEKVHHVIRRSHQSTKRRCEQVVLATLAQAMASA